VNWKTARQPQSPPALDAAGLRRDGMPGDGTPWSGSQSLEAAARADFARVYEEHFEFVWRSLRLLGVRSDALDDVSQDVFSAVARQLGCFEGRSSLRTWLFGISQNIASNHRRLRARKLDRLESLGGHVASSEPSPLAHAEGREAADAILEFCDGLDEGRRAVFVLGLLEGVPAPEIAALLGISVNTVYSRIRTLRDALERRLAEREGEL
jgi:RNA polymerase sigma-70 factor, ECF subfamily